MYVDKSLGKVCLAAREDTKEASTQKYGCVLVLEDVEREIYVKKCNTVYLYIITFYFSSFFYKTFIQRQNIQPG
jgi:hypothetical protein